jgi:hypothetical protein
VKNALRAQLGPAPRIAPAFAHPLKGHSGAQVVLHTEGGRTFVRKTAAHPAVNARLIAQAEKQHRLFMLALPFPRILAQGMEEDRVCFDMAYLPGRTVADAAINAAPLDAALVARTVQRMVWLFLPCAGGTIPARLFQEKIESIGRIDHAGLRACAARLLIQDWQNIPQSPSHGDLTLENILLTSGKSVALIDCDEPWASSWWLDFGKLFQDIDGHWCLRDLYAPGAASLRRINAIQKLESLGQVFRALAAANDPALPARLPQLAALSLLRAAPYARDIQTLAFICARIHHLLDTMN